MCFVSKCLTTCTKQGHMLPQFRKIITYNLYIKTINLFSTVLFNVCILTDTSVILALCNERNVWLTL